MAGSQREYEVTTLFAIEWAQRQAICPAGKASHSWREHKDAWGNPIISIKSSHTDSRLYSTRVLCTKTKTDPLHLTIKPQAEFDILQQARREQQTGAWQTLYHRRAGIEGTLSQAVRAFDLRQCRYRGLTKTSLPHILTVVALNMIRLVRWFHHLP